MIFESLTYDALIEALIATNGDCTLIENPKDARKWIEWGRGFELAMVLPEEEEFEGICAKLDLIPANKPKRVFKILDGAAEVGYIALAPDWVMA